MTEWNIRSWCWRPISHWSSTIRFPWVHTVTGRYKPRSDYTCCQDIKLPTNLNQKSTTIKPTKSRNLNSGNYINYQHSEHKWDILKYISFLDTWLNPHITPFQYKHYILLKQKQSPRLINWCDLINKLDLGAFTKHLLRHIMPSQFIRTCYGWRFVCLLIYAISTVFQLYLGGDMMSEIRKPKPIDLYPPTPCRHGMRGTGLWWGYELYTATVRTFMGMRKRSTRIRLVFS